MANTEAIQSHFAACLVRALLHLPLATVWEPSVLTSQLAHALTVLLSFVCSVVFHDAFSITPARSLILITGVISGDTFVSQTSAATEREREGSLANYKLAIVSM